MYPLCTHIHYTKNIHSLNWCRQLSCFITKNIYTCIYLTRPRCSSWTPELCSPQSSWSAGPPPSPSCLPEVDHSLPTPCKPSLHQNPCFPIGKQSKQLLKNLVVSFKILPFNMKQFILMKKYIVFMKKKIQ